MVTTVLEVKNLWKKYDEDWVLKDINLKVKKGQFLGVIGENGAGKSTLIQNILGLSKPSQGDILINGTSITQDEIGAKKSLAYIPELPLLYKDLTVWEHLKFVAMSFEMTKEDFNQKATSLLKQFGLWEKRNMVPTNFSKGMKQKVAVSCALLHDGDILLVDEPFTGLDVRSVRELKGILFELNQRGKTIIIATHILDAAEKMCEEFLMIKKGEILATGDLSTLIKKAKIHSDATLEEVFFSLGEGGNLSNE